MKINLQLPFRNAGLNIAFKNQDKILSSNVEDTLEKGRKGASIGEERQYGGKPYVKTANGWVPKHKVGENDKSEPSEAQKKTGEANWRGGNPKKKEKTATFTAGMYDRLDKLGYSHKDLSDGSKDKYLHASLRNHADEVGNKYSDDEYNDLVDEYKGIKKTEHEKDSAGKKESYEWEKKNPKKTSSGKVIPWNYKDTPDDGSWDEKDHAEASDYHEALRDTQEKGSKEYNHHDQQSLLHGQEYANLKNSKGKTKSGKRIHNQQNAKTEKDYSVEDHMDAMYHHLDEAVEHGKAGRHEVAQQHLNEADRHNAVAKGKKAYQEMLDDEKGKK